MTTDLTTGLNIRIFDANLITMAYSTKFYLKSPKAKGTSLVMMSFTFGFIHDQPVTKTWQKYDRVRVSTGEKINPKFWDAKEGKAKTTPNFPAIEFNTSLTRKKAEIEEIYRRYNNNKVHPTPAMIKNEIDAYLKKRPAVMAETFLQFIERFSLNAKVTKKGAPISPLTIRKYNNTLNILKEFEKHRKEAITLKGIDRDFYNDFLVFMQEKRKFSLNTCGKQVKVLKFFIRQAIDAGNEYDLRKLDKFTAPSEATDKAYLTLHEITKLNELDYGDTLRGRIKDLFVCACLTGLRFSDLNAICKENITELDGQKYLEIPTYKTGQRVTIPLHPVALEILTRTNYSLKVYSNQIMNRELKPICEKANINEMVSIQESIAGKRVIKTAPKSEFITTHSARRSFATNAFLSGLSAHDIMPLTGHKTEKAFLAYIRSDSMANAIKLKDSAFFQGKTPMKVVNQ